MKKTELLGSAPIPRALLAMGLPTMIGMMISALYNLADTYFVSGLGTGQMGAVSVAFPLGQAVVGVGLLFGNGAASYLARLLGKGEREEADRTASAAVYGSIAAGVVITVFALIFLEPLLKVLGAIDSIRPYAAAYTEVYMLSSVFSIFNVTMNSIVTAEGAANTTMLTMLAGAVLNVFLDPLFIYSMGLGIAGAAYATAVSQIFSSLIYLCYILRRRSLFTFRPGTRMFSKKIMAEIAKIGVPTLIFQLLTAFAVTLTNWKAADYGDSAIAGMGAAIKIISLGNLIVFGFIKGFQPIAGYNYGAKNNQRLALAVKTAVWWTTLFCILFGTMLILFRSEIISQFTKGDTDLVHIGEQALATNGFTFMLFGFYTVYSSLFLSLGKAKEGFFLGICRQGICFVPIILLAPGFMGIKGIICAQPVADVISFFIAVIMAVILHKKLSKESAMPY